MASHDLQVFPEAFGPGPALIFKVMNVYGYLLPVAESAWQPLPGIATRWPRVSAQCAVQCGGGGGGCGGGGCGAYRAWASRRHAGQRARRRVVGPPAGGPRL